MIDLSNRIVKVYERVLAGLGRFSLGEGLTEGGGRKAKGTMG
jgi:hypothetical protein